MKLNSWFLYHRFGWLLAIFLLVSLACSLPALQSGSQPDPTQPAARPTSPAPQATPDSGAGPQPGITTEAPGSEIFQGIPPALVEVIPPANSELSPGDTPVFYFNQPMERASVEAALKVLPEGGGKFEWLDDATARFVPGRSPSPENGLSITIAAQARSALGKALTSPVVVAYRAPAPLRVSERLPVPGAAEVDPFSAVVITFNTPVTSLSADSQAEPPFTLEPEVPGSGKWINTSTYAFYPEPALMGGMKYTVRLQPELQSAAGSPLEEGSAGDWTFATASPALLSVEPGLEQPVALDEAFKLTFNQPMALNSVEAAFSMRGPGGEAVPGMLAWNTAHTEATFQPADLLERGTTYSLHLTGDAHSIGGAQIGSDFSAVLVSVPPFSVIQTHPAAGEALATFDGYATVALDFGSPLASGQDLDSLVRITPSVIDLNISRSYDGYQLYLSGYFQPSTSYALSVSPELRDRWEARLGSPFNFTFSTQPARPALVIPARQIGAQVLFVPYSETNLPAYATNIARVTVARGTVGLSEFILTAQSGRSLQNWESRVEDTWVRAYYPTPNRSESIDIPLSNNADLLPPGLYFLHLGTQPVINPGSENPPFLFVVSPFQMVVKISARQGFVWVTRISDGSPVTAREVTFYDATARPVTSCVTDAEGICQAELPAVENGLSALYAVMGQPGEPEFSLGAVSWSSGVSPWEFQLAFQNQGGKPEIYLYTDRPIYRPGQAVQFRAVVRNQDNGRYSLPEPGEFVVDVLAPYNPINSQNLPLATLRLPLSPYGTATGVYTLPDDAPAGMYTLQPQNAGMESIYFEVAEYRKPEIDLSVQFSEPDRLAGQDLQAQVRAAYFFGAPAGSLSVRWSLFRVPRSPSMLEGMSTGRADTSWMYPWSFWAGQEMFLLEGSGQTGPDGSLTVEINGADLSERMAQDGGNLNELILEVTAEDESGLPVSARGSMLLHPAPTYVGVRPEQWTGSAGSEMTFQIRHISWNGEPEGGKLLRSRFRKVIFSRQSQTDPYGPVGLTAEYSDAGSTDFVTSSDGEARLAYTPAEPGTYMIEISSEDGAIAQQIVWVGGTGGAPWPQLPNQRITLRSQQSSYSPGQSAQIFIPNPFSSGALGLITVERGRVMRAFVVQIQDSSYVLDLPLAEEDAPNVFVSVTLLGRSNGRPDFRQGYLELQVDPASLLLNVELLSSPRQTQPGEQAVFQIGVTDAAGQPVRGEFSLALVDRAVLALAEPNSTPILQAFYGKQPLSVNMGLSLANYAGRFLNIVEGRGGGGGGGEIAAPLTVRSNFEDTAFWSGSIETDENGIAQVSLVLPDNLTTWRADVRGVTLETQVGQAEVDLVTSKPLLIRPVVPRFVVSGDHLELSAVVHNNTEETLQASVRLETPGFSLDEPNRAVQPVEVPAGGRVRVSWWGSVQNVSTLDLAFSVEAGDLQDATRPEDGPLPVLRYSSSQTFGTSGMLAEPGVAAEWIALPRSFTPTGGALTVEVAASLSAAVLDSLAAQENLTYEFTEPVVSRILPNASATALLSQYPQAGDSLPVKALDLQNAAVESTERLVRSQNEDGGWGWASGFASDPYLSSYVLFGLAQAAQIVQVDSGVLTRAQDYLLANLNLPTPQSDPAELDQLAFQIYALQQSRRLNIDLNPLYEARARLSPAGQAFLALTLHGQPDGGAEAGERARTVLSDILSGASRSATGVYWQSGNPGGFFWNTPAYHTAVVVYAIAKIDPQSPVLIESARYLLLNRPSGSRWNSSYEAAWSLLALLETLSASGDLEADYAYTASLNGSPLIQGQADTLGQTLKPVSAHLSLEELAPNVPNALQIERSEGEGRLYYRAFLRVDRPAQEALAVQRGMALTRRYYRAGQDCRNERCIPADMFDLADPQPVLVRLTLTVPEDMRFVVVEDFIPAGAEVLNPRLKTSQQYLVPDESQAAIDPYNLENPFEEGWGWWWFKDPVIQNERIRWVVDDLPAGTYELTYRLTPLIAGDFRVLPARAWQYYFPDVEGSTAGEIIRFE